MAATVATLGIISPAAAQSGWEPARGSRGMVASAEAHATRVGVDVLKRGGNAVDAAVAVALVLAVTYPAAGNLGGGGFMLIRMAGGQTTCVDYRETAPARAGRDMYVGRDGAVDRDAATIGYRAAAVPGTVAGLALALEKHGTMKWREVVEPARQLAAEGFPLPHGLARSLRAEADLLGRFAEGKRIFLDGGRFLPEGAVFKQPELAETLRRLQDSGPREFYEGRTAELIAEDMRASGGLITLEDLRAYRPLERTAVRGTYRRHEIISMPPPSSGGVVLIEMLNMLETHDLRGLGPDSSARQHLLIEVMRRAYADRAEYLGDPDFADVPAAALLGKDYARRRAATIDPRRAGDSTRIGPGDLVRPADARPAATTAPNRSSTAPFDRERRETTHFSIVDAAGNAVANTYTLNGSYGSGAVVRGAGFLLNNEMDDFAARPGAPNAYGLIQGERNAIAPGKRPLSSMTPTFVLADGKLLLVAGSPGGPTIINTVLQIIVNVVDHDMNVRRAVEAPRIHHQWMPDVVAHEPLGLAADVRAALEARGHRLAARPEPMGNAQVIMIEPGTGVRLGAADPRGSSGLAEGY